VDSGIAQRSTAHDTAVSTCVRSGLTTAPGQLRGCRQVPVAPNTMLQLTSVNAIRS
jgi:hypothetical protein